jgi:predicted dehydrogenase
MADRVRVAVIGLGAMGANHARVFAGLPDAALVAVADSDAARLPNAGPRVYTDYRALLVGETLDAVSIAVPTRSHFDVAIACIERGLPLLVEKPLGADLDECRRLKTAAEAAGVPLMVGHIERFNPAVLELKRLLDSGEMGTAGVLSAQRTGPFFERERDVGVVHDLATHDIDVMRYLLGLEVESAQAEVQRGVRTPFEDALQGELLFQGGAQGRLEVSWLTDNKVRLLTVSTDTTVFLLDYITQELRHLERAGAPLPPADSFALVSIQRQEPLRAELEAFLRVARREIAPPVTADDAIAAMRVVEALVESASTGRTMRLAAESTAG